MKTELNAVQDTRLRFYTPTQYNAKKTMERTKALKGSFSEQRVAPLFAENSPVTTIKRLLGSYPELKLLTTPTQVAPTPETGTARIAHTIGEEVFHLPRSATIEFDRTAVSLLTLGQVLHGDYARFTASQDPTTRLSEQSFQALHTHTRSVLGNLEALDAMVTYLAINDLGKTHTIKDYVEKREKKKETDHSALLVTALTKYPFLSRSFQRLPSHYKEIMLKGLQANFKIAQLIQGENVPASLEGLQNLSQEALQFYLLHALFDIAGAQGQFVQNGSAVMTEQTYQRFQTAIGALGGFSQGQSPEQVYTNFLIAHSEQVGLPTKTPGDLAVARITCMIRLAIPEEAETVAQVFANLPDETRKLLEQELTTTGIHDNTAILLYYAPALLTNIRKAVERSGDANALQTSTELGLQVLAHAYQQVRETIPKRIGNGVYTADIADLAKKASEDPQILLTRPFIITSFESGSKIAIQ